MTTTQFILVVLAAAVQGGTPILYATLGEIITERAGVLNLGVEGMMMVGAFSGFLALHFTGNPWFAFCVGGLFGALFGCLHGMLCLIFQGNQVVSGLTLTIFGVGLASYLGTPYLGVKTEGFSSFPVPFLSDIPYLGLIFFRQDALVYCSYFLPLLIWFFFVRTRWGVALRATGENPAAVAAAGLSPRLLRWFGVAAGGFLCGLGGAYLSLAYTHLWDNSIIAGRGWIAVALVIFSFWRPGRAVFGAYLFGGVIAFQLRWQASGDAFINTSILKMLPYLLTLVVLLWSSARGKGRASPASLGVNLEPDLR